MKELKVGRRKVLLYDSIDDLPLENWHKINKYMLIEAGVGSTLLDFDERIKGSLIHLKAGNLDKAATEINNMRQLFLFLTNEMSVAHLAFACLVHSIDGEMVKDISDEGLKNVLRKIDAQSSNDGSVGDPGIDPVGPKKVLRKSFSDRFRFRSGNKEVRTGGSD